MGLVVLAVEAHPLDLQRQHEARGHGMLRGLEEGEPRPVVADVAERYRRSQCRTDRLWRALRIPTRPRQMSRQYVALEHAALAGQRHPGRVQRHYQRLEFRYRPQYHRFRLVALLHLEPLEAVRRNRT